MSKYQAIENDYLGSGVVKVKRISDQKVSHQSALNSNTKTTSANPRYIQEFACKTINYLKDHVTAKKHAETEYEILSMLKHHRNITRFIEGHFIEGQSDTNQLRLYMEYYPNGTLENLIAEKRRFAYHILLLFMISLMSRFTERVCASQSLMCGQSSGS